MSVIGNSAPYGKDREFSHFIQTILTLVENQPNYIFSLALLSNNDDEFSRIQGFFEDETNDLGLLSSIFESISIISAPFLDQNTGFSREERHKDSVQRLRRRLIAKSRNFIMLNALESQQYILTIDSDMVRFDEAAKIIPTFVNSDKDIIVPRIERPGLRDYDKNSWRGERTKPNQEQLDKMDNNDWEHWGYVPRDVKANMYHFQTYLDNKDNEYDLHKDEYEYIIPLDSVGGAILFMKSIVVKQGVIFPTSLIVGTTWDRVEGYDGIETEGICYLAKPLGFSCWGMPNVVGHHTGG
ncbi:mnn9 Mannan polymerase complex subunit mnn9 [Candida maltosa Xu316]